MSLGIVSKCFENNTSGDNWISNFVKRNLLSKREHLILKGPGQQLTQI